MGYLNSDDMLAPDTLHFIADYFQAHPKIDAIYSHRCLVNAQNRVVGYWILPSHNNYLMQRFDLIPQETCFWRRRLFETAGNIDASYRFAMDYDLFVRFMKQGVMARVNRVLARSAFTTNPRRCVYSPPSAKKRNSVSKTSMVSRLTGATSLRISLAVKALRWRSWWHKNKLRVLTGSLPGIGYDYDDVWGGQLNDTRLPAFPVTVRPETVAA